MTTITGVILFDLLAILVSLFAVVYANFYWTYGLWKRKNVPYFKPSFPFGNLHPFRSNLSLGNDVYNIGKKAKKQGE